MYPFIRMAKERVVNRSKQSISVGETYESYHICWPWDLDFWFELNNGLALTLYDLGRIPFSDRSGFSKVILKNKWSMTWLVQMCDTENVYEPLSEYECKPEQSAGTKGSYILSKVCGIQKRVCWPYCLQSCVCRSRRYH